MYWPLFQFTCVSDHPCSSNVTTTTPTMEEDLLMLIHQNDAHRKCSLPQYVSLSATFAFLSVSVFLRYGQTVEWPSPNDL